MCAQVRVIHGNENMNFLLFREEGMFRNKLRFSIFGGKQMTQQLYKSLFVCCIVLMTVLHVNAECNAQGFLKYRKWHPVELNFQGPRANETDNDPNPFLDYRLQVIFTSPNGTQYNVPGFFNGDGKGEGKGNIWTVRFTPDQDGKWVYLTSFRRGKNVAIELNPTAGEAAAFDGKSGSFDVLPADQKAPGFLKWGRLNYTGRHYLKFADGPYWIKGGIDSPEDFLSYTDFDNTPNAGHRYEAHVVDWQEGDPVWDRSKGKGIIGLLNYFASQHVNSIYFLTQNIGGDGKNVWPFTGKIDPEGSPENDNIHYDVSKLYQWNTVFNHAQNNGIFLHFVLNEAEEKNKRELDEAELGIERKLYYRELIARFGHHNALQWNLSEEFDLFLDLTPGRIRDFAQYIVDMDPYDHPVTVHNEGRDPDPNWLPFLGDHRLSTTSFQFYEGNAKWGERVEKWRRLTEIAGRPLPINLDEFLLLNENNQEQVRKEMLWPTYLSGGQLEYIMERYLRNENFKITEQMWQWTWYARRFMQEHLPFWEMQPDDMALIEGTKVLGGPQVFAKHGEIYAIYLPVAEPEGKLTMWRIEGQFRQRWYNPRTGNFEGELRHFNAQGTVPLGNPPHDPHEDWVILIEKISDTNGGSVLKSFDREKGYFEEINGVLIIEAESLPFSNVWEFNTKPEGFTGEGWLKYVGPNSGEGTKDGHNTDVEGKYQGKPEDRLIARIKINTPGTYTALAHVYHEMVDGDNDAWINLMSTPLSARRFGDNHNARKKFGWNMFNCWTEEEHPCSRKGLQFEFEKGEYELYWAGRSRGFGIDRMVLYQDGLEADALHPAILPTPFVKKGK